MYFLCCDDGRSIADLTIMGVLQICDTLSELAGKIPDVDKTWPELLPFIFSCVQSGDPRLMEAALNVFAELARSMMTTLMQYMGTLHQVGATPPLHTQFTAACESSQQRPFYHALSIEERRLKHSDARDLTDLLTAFQVSHSICQLMPVRCPSRS